MEAVQMMTAVVAAEAVSSVPATQAGATESSGFDAMMFGQVSDAAASVVVPTDQASDMSAQELVSAQIMAMIGNQMPVMMPVEQKVVDAGRPVEDLNADLVRQQQISPAQFMTGIALLQGMPAVKAAVEQPSIEQSGTVLETEGLTSTVMPITDASTDVIQETGVLPKELSLPAAVKDQTNAAVKAEKEAEPIANNRASAVQLVMPQVALGPEKAADKSRLVQQAVQSAASQPVTQQGNPVEPVVADIKNAAQIQQADGQDAAVQVVSAQTRSAAPDVQVRSVNVVPDQVRFAKSPDVVMAAVKPETSGENQSGTKQQPEEQQISLKGKDTVKPAVETVSANEVTLVQQRGSDQLAGQQGVSRQFTVTAAQPGPVHAEQQAVLPEHLARQVSDRIILAEPKGGSEQISLKLSPEHLGNLQMNLKMENQKLQVEIIAEHRSVRDAILQQADSLKETLSRQNIQVDSFDVTTSGNAMQQQFKEWRQTQENQQQHSGQQGSNRVTVAARGFADAPVRYFEKQYSSTIDLRF